MDLKKPLTKNQKIFCVFAIFLIIILISPGRSLLLARKLTCQFSQENKSDLCLALSGKNSGPSIGDPRIEISGYHYTVQPSGSSDFNTTTYNLITGKMAYKCGYWIGLVKQTSSCASAEELEKWKKRP